MRCLLTGEGEWGDEGYLTIERDFPRTYREFVERFPSVAASAAYLEHLRGSTEFSCPACGVSGAPWRQKRGRLVCPTCRHQTSVTADTILERTLGTGYRSAATAAMVRSERERLSGGVEVDETLVGSVAHGGTCEGGPSNVVVVIAVEVKEPRRFGRVRMRHVPDASGACRRTLKHVAPSTTKRDGPGETLHMIMG